MNNYDQCKIETHEHIENVNFFINKICEFVKLSGAKHDNSKLISPELDYFANIDRHTLDTTFGTLEYQENLNKLKPALINHYAKNRHHPEFHNNGIHGMNLIDIIEMFCDWFASCQRYKEGDILKSIDINAKRYNISDDLVSIFKNTASLL